MQHDYPIRTIANLMICKKWGLFLRQSDVRSPSRDNHGYKIIRILRPAQEADLDAAHFRERAARAREMAQSGDDLRLSRMLLEVALDLDAEAEAMEAKGATPRPGLRRPDLHGARLHMVGSDADTRPAQVLRLSAGGASLRVDRPQVPGSKVALELPAHTIRLEGTILRARGLDAAMVFDRASGTDPDLNRLLGCETVADRVEA